MTVRGVQTALADRAQALLDELADAAGSARVEAPPPQPAACDEWWRSGLAALTGDGVAWATPAFDPLEGVNALLRAVKALAPRDLDLDVCLLTERAALRGLRPRGTIACNGATRLLRARNAWLAISLPRPEDREMLPAWLGIEGADDPWDEIASAVATRSAADVADAGQRLSLAIAVADLEQCMGDMQWRSRGRRGQAPLLRRMARPARVVRSAPLVIDCSALWAGPLCGHLLLQSGARVIKVESVNRPDGARGGHSAFFDLLNAGKESVAIDFRRAEDVARLRRLMLRADVIIESSRPRAFAQLGLSPETLFAERPSLTWVSITAYGRSGPWRDHAGFGDDAAASGGLLARNAKSEPVFIGDAIADPITGIAAAAGAFASMRAGGGFMVDAALREAAAFVAASAPLSRSHATTAAPPRARAVKGRAAELGSDTSRVMAEFGL